MQLIDEKTRIPLFAAICAMPFLAGGIIWLSTIDSTAATALEEARKNTDRIDVQMNFLVDIRERLVRIEERLRTKTNN